MKEPFCFRLQSALEQRNLSMREFAAMCEVTGRSRGVKVTPQDVSRYIAGTSVPREDKLGLMADTLGVNVFWLMGYEASDALTTEELSLLEAWRRCTPKERKTIASVLEDYGFKLEEKNTLSSEYA